MDQIGADSIRKASLQTHMNKILELQPQRIIYEEKKEDETDTKSFKVPVDHIT